MSSTSTPSSRCCSARCSARLVRSRRSSASTARAAFDQATCAMVASVSASPTFARALMMLDDDELHGLALAHEHVVVDQAKRNRKCCEALELMISVLDGRSQCQICREQAFAALTSSRRRICSTVWSRKWYVLTPPRPHLMTLRGPATRRVRPMIRRCRRVR